VVTSAWVVAAQPDGSFQRERLFGHTAVHYFGWVSGIVAGVLAPPLDATVVRLDAVSPAFFLGLMFTEIRARRRAAVAALAATMTVALIPGTATGVPILVASAATLLGLARAPRSLSTAPSCGTVTCRKRPSAADHARRVRRRGRG